MLDCLASICCIAARRSFRKLNIETLPLVAGDRDVRAQSYKGAAGEAALPAPQANTLAQPPAHRTREVCDEEVHRRVQRNAQAAQQQDLEGDVALRVDELRKERDE